MTGVRVLRYDARTRRRARSLARIAWALHHPAVYPRVRFVGAFWWDGWDGRPNFGDALTPWLLPKYGVVPVLRPAESAALTGAGSILQMLPRNYRGAVWGSGSMSGEPVALPCANFWALRGHLSSEVLGITRSVPLGDPGILVGRHLRRFPARWRLGVVPHGTHEANSWVRRLKERYPREVTVISTRHSVERTVRQISQCCGVVSSSLHGLITADSFGIPAGWVQFEPKLWGGDFKFRDYESVVSSGRTRAVIIDDDMSVENLEAQLGQTEPDLFRASQDALERALLEGIRVIATSSTLSSSLRAIF